MFAIELRQELIETSEPADEWADASCRDETGGLTELFFSDQIPDIVRAKRICATCPVIAPCLRGGPRAARAVGRLGRSVVPQRQGAGPEAAPGPAAQESPARGRHPADGLRPGREPGAGAPRRPPAGRRLRFGG